MKKSSSKSTFGTQGDWPEARFEVFDPIDGQVEARARAVKAYRDGHAQGQATALQELERRLQPLESLLNTALSECASFRTRVLHRLEQDLVGLVTEMAWRVIGQELKTAPDAILAVVRAVLDMGSNQDDLVLRVHPQDYEILATSRGEFLQSMEDLEGFRLVRDPKITPGGCVLATRSGLIDGRLESRLARAESVLSGEGGS